MLVDKKPVEKTPPIKSIDWLNAGLFAFSLLAGSSLLLISFIGVLAIMLGGASSDLSLPDNQRIASLLFTFGLGFGGMLLIPAVFYSGRRLFGNRPPVLLNWDKIAWMAYLFPIPILFGYLIQTGPGWSLYLLPIVHLLANGAGLVSAYIAFRILKIIIS